MYGVLLYADAGVDGRTGNEESYKQRLEYELHDEGVDARRISRSISEPDGARLRNMSTGMTSFTSFGSRASSGTHDLPHLLPSRVAFTNQRRQRRTIWKWLSAPYETLV